MTFKSALKYLFALLFICIMILLLLVYLILPLDPIDFIIESPPHSNFNLDPYDSKEMQFYPNMRYSSSNITYRIDEVCGIKKKDDMTRAFEIVEELTILKFYPVKDNEEISVTCSDDVIVKEDHFIAGEGGPVNIVQTQNFNIILNGKILLIRDSQCETPNIAIHELFHALGFDHSENPNNIMYPVTRCSQTIGQDIPNLINQIYSIPSYPDLNVYNASAIMKRKFLDINVSIKNQGLKDSEVSTLLIYADDKIVKEEELDPLKVGYGVTMMFKNIFIPQISVEKIKIEVETNFSEIETKNNILFLEIKK